MPAEENNTFTEDTKPLDEVNGVGIITTEAAEDKVKAKDKDEVAKEEDAEEAEEEKDTVQIKPQDATMMPLKVRPTVCKLFPANQCTMH